MLRREAAGMKRSNSLIVGLTGGIATGKSTVSTYLNNHGYLIIDADQIGREVVEKGQPALMEIKEIFGAEMITSEEELNRRKMRKHVFGNPEALKKLNAITHPRIIEKIEEKIQFYKKNAESDIIFLDCPLLFELKLERLVDEVWTVYTTQELQIKRLIKRDQVSRKEAMDVIKAQLPMDVKIEKADVVLNNTGDIELLYCQIENYLEQRS